MRSNKERASVMACRILLERAYGRPDNQMPLLLNDESEGATAIQVTFVAANHADADDELPIRHNGNGLRH